MAELAALNRGALAALPGALAELPAALQAFPMVRLDQSSFSQSLVVSLAFDAILLVSCAAHSGILHESCQRGRAASGDKVQPGFC